MHVGFHSLEMSGISKSIELESGLRAGRGEGMGSDCSMGMGFPSGVMQMF